MKHYLGICLILLTLAMIVLFALRRCEDAAGHAADKVVHVFQEAFQVRPEVRINHTVIYAQTAPIAELAIVSKEQLVSYTLSEKYQFLQFDVPLTKKQLTAQAIYRVKAGFDLRQPFRVEIARATGRVTATLPAPQILSVERIGDLSLQDESAWLNRITPEERQRVLNDLDRVAREAAQKSSLVEDARRQALARLNELARQNGQEITVKEFRE